MNYLLWNAKLGGWMTRSSQWTSEKGDARRFTLAEAKEICLLHNRGGLRLLPIREDDMTEFGL